MGCEHSKNTENIEIKKVTTGRDVVTYCRNNDHACHDGAYNDNVCLYCRHDDDATHNAPHYYNSW